MAYTVDNQDKSVLTWDDNPYQGDSHAIVVDGEITELVVSAQQGGNIIYSLNQTELSHLKDVITDLLNFLTPV